MTDLLAQTLDNPIIPTIALGLAATVGALWLAAAWWAYRDASRRAGSSFAGLLAAAWVVLSSPLLLPLSLGVYTLARPQHSAAEKRSRRLIRELVDQLDGSAQPRCPACTAEVDAMWLRCPDCATWLAQPCSSCGGWSDPRLEVCPFCGGESRDLPAVETLEPAFEPIPAFEAPTAPGTGSPRKRRGRHVQRHGVGAAAAGAAGAGTTRDPREPRRRVGVPVMAEARLPAHARAR